MTIHRTLLIAALLLAHSPAHAASFDCHRGRSLTEKMICNDPALSKLDDTLGQLYWKARRRVTNRRAFLNDSDTRWAWREANCRDLACLGTWYATRIGELQRLIDSMQAARPSVPATPAEPDAQPTAPTAFAPPVPRTAVAMRQCTAANPGIEVAEQCSTVLKETSSRWRYAPPDGGWFCGVAMLAPAQMQEGAQR